MKIQNLFRMLCVAGTIGLFGCGGGGSSPAAPPATVTKTTISGKLEYPSMSSLVAKSVGSVVTDALVTVQAYTLEGDPVGTPVTPTYDDTVSGASTDFTLRVYTYVLPEIPVGKDYVVRAKRIENGKTQELKKLIEKADVIVGMPEQKLDSVSTAAVVVASQKLSTSMGITTGVQITLGDPLPSLGTKTVENLSEAIFTEVAPKALEDSIQAAKTNSATSGIVTYLSTLTPEEKKAFVDLVNMLNIVVTAVANNADPAKILAGESVTLSTAATAPQLKLLTYDSTTGTATQETVARTTITSQIIQDTVTSSVESYVPPSRVQLEVSTNVAVGTLYGVKFDITVPLDAQVKLTNLSDDGLSYAVDMKSVNMATDVAAGTLSDAQYTPSTRKLSISIAGTTSLPTGKLFSVVFDRTAGKPIIASNFAITTVPVDLNGQPLQTGFGIIKTAISSGL